MTIFFRETDSEDGQTAYGKANETDRDCRKRLIIYTKRRITYASKLIPTHGKGYTDVRKRLFHETEKALPQHERAFSASPQGVNETGGKDNPLDDKKLHKKRKTGIF